MGKWEQLVFQDTHKEYRMQAPHYDPEAKYPSFQDLLAHFPRAEELHNRVSTVAISYLRQLQGKMPDIHNPLGDTWVPFKNFQFTILQSNIQDPSIHKIQMDLYSEPLMWLETFGESLLVASAEHEKRMKEGKEIETQLISLQPNFTISSVTSPTMSWNLLSTQH